MNKPAIKRLQGRIDGMNPKKTTWWPPSLFTQFRKPVETDYCTYWENHPEKVHVDKSGMAIIPICTCPFSSEPFAMLGGYKKNDPTETGEPLDDRTCQDCKYWKPKKKPIH